MSEMEGETLVDQTGKGNASGYLRSGGVVFGGFLFLLLYRSAKVL